MGPQLRAPGPAVHFYPIQSSSRTQACSGSSSGIVSHIREVGGNKIDIPFLLLLFFTLQFCASCQWAAAWFNYDIHIQHISCLGDSFTTELISEGRGKYHLLKIMSIRITFRDADVLYLWKEGREEIILVNYLLQISFSVYMLICRFLCNLERWKEKYNPCGLPITDTDSRVYVSCDPLNLSLPLYCYFLGIVSLCLNSQGFFLSFRWFSLIYLKIFACRDIIFFCLSRSH